VEEQIKLVNQELLLEKMHSTEECDQLLVDVDTHAEAGAFSDSEVAIDTTHFPKHAAKFVSRPTTLRPKDRESLTCKFNYSS